MWSIIGARQGGDVVINILSKAEKSYIQSSLLSDPPLRLDSRSLEDYRPISLKTGVVPLANGSAKICIGRPGRGHRARPGGRRRRRRDGSGHLELAAVREEEEGGKVVCTVSWWVIATFFLPDAFHSVLTRPSVAW